MNESDRTSFDEALARRLAKLSTMPVDTSRLDQALRAEISPPVRDAVTRTNWRRALRPVAAVAASLVLIAIVGFAFLNDRPVRADAVVQLHRDMVAGKVKTMDVTSMEEVNKAFTAMGCGAPAMTSDVKPHCCCVGKLGNRKVPCLMMNCDSVPVTMAVLDKGDLKLPSSTQIHNGQTYHTAAHGEMNLVITQRGEHAVCLVGAISTTQLIALADQVKF